MKFKILLIFSLICQIVFCQSPDLEILKDVNLLKNANTLVLNQATNIDIKAQNLMTVSKTRKIMVLNELGLSNIDAFLYYDTKSKIKKLQLSIFQPGQDKPIKIFKEKDFKDNNASDGFSVATDTRIKIAEYQHLGKYPFVAEFSYEYNTSNTAHIPKFIAVQNNNEATFLNTFQINYLSELGFQFLNKNLQNFPIKFDKTDTSVKYTVTNLPYLEKEQYSLGYNKIMPNAIFGLHKFNLEGVDAEVNNWVEFGKWYHGNFVNSFQELSPQTVLKVNELTKNINDPIEKAKVLYQFMQSRTRYISVQLGIGGWKPFPANYVDQKGIGDCKALSNYMAALLKAANVPAYVTIVSAGDEIEDINEEIVSLQGNHMILAIPNKKEYVFLECTSQTNPFSYLSNFTDGRKVVIVKPEGAVIYKTPILLNDKNIQTTKTKLFVDTNGVVKSNIKIENKGEFYDSCQSLSTLESNEMIKSVKNRYDLIKDIKNLKFKLNDNKELVLYTEEYDIETNPMIKRMGNQSILPLNLIHPLVHIPKNYSDKKFDFVISRGYTYVDELEIELPENSSLIFVPESKEIKSEFGDYKLTITSQSNKISVIRVFNLFNNQYDKSKYNNYKKFREDISLLESSKLTYKI